MNLGAQSPLRLKRVLPPCRRSHLCSRNTPHLQFPAGPRRCWAVLSHGCPPPTVLSPPTSTPEKLLFSFQILFSPHPLSRKPQTEITAPLYISFCPPTSCCHCMYHSAITCLQWSPVLFRCGSKVTWKAKIACNQNYPWSTLQLPIKSSARGFVSVAFTGSSDLLG